MKIASPPPAADAAPPAAPPPVGADQQSAAPEDFMALLTELVSASASATTSQAASETVANVATADKDEDTDADIANLIPIALPIQQFDLPKDAVANADSQDEIEALLGTMTKGQDAQAAQMLDATLAPTGDGDTKQPKDVQTTPPTVAFADALNAHRLPATTADTAAQTTVNSPVGSPQWHDEIGARVSLMVQQGNHSASLRLSPEHLGPLEVRISVDNDQASVWFGAAHADTRAAIEHALPRLRELFASQGLSLADAGVFREPPREQPKQGSFNGSSRSESSTEPQTVQTIMIKRLGLVDAYA